MEDKKLNNSEDILLSFNIPFEILKHNARTAPWVKSTAEALAVPERMLVQVVEFVCTDKKYAAFIPADCKFDTIKASYALNTEAEKIILQAAAGDDMPYPFALSTIKSHKDIEIILDQKLLEISYIVFPTEDSTESVKIDSRFLGTFKFRAADLSAQKKPEKKKSGFEVLLERGFVERTTNEERSRELLSDEKVSAYIGFDPTADSLHVGSLVPIMALTNLQRAGNPIIAIVGGATAMIGDPSGKTEMRKMLTLEDIERNLQGIKKQLSSFLTFDEGKGKVMNNADWLANKNYLEFLREVGIHFSVNKMLTAECFRTRMDKGLSFIEFNYMLLQAYDFMKLSEKHHCMVQMGGSDQWGNICAGVELGRRANSMELSGVTFPLLMNSSGKKFGKTESGNVWLDAARTSPYDYFQFWRNTEDTDVRKFLQLFTLIPMERIREITSPDMNINTAKKILAFAATSLAHGELNAVESAISAETLFGGDASILAGELQKYEIITEDGYKKMLELSAAKKADAIDQISISLDKIKAGVPVSDALFELGFAESKSKAKQLIKQGAVTVNNEKVSDIMAMLKESDIDAEKSIMLRSGKKKYGRVVVE